MASFSLSNLLSFLLPSKTSPPQPSLPPIRASFSAQKPRDASLSMAAEERDSGFNSSSYSSSLSSELASVICPSLAYSNTLFFKSAYNVQVIVDENEPEERLLNRFKREVMKAGVIQECKRRRFFENTQDEKKRKTREAAKRNRRRRPQSRFLQQNKPEASPTKKDDEEDNWEWTEGDDVPY